MKYTCADKGHVRNLGEGIIEGKSTDGIPIKMKIQVGDKMNRMLISVSRVSEGGNMVLFNADRRALRELLRKQGELAPNMIVNKKSGINSKIHKENGLYTHPIWTKRKVRKEIAKVGNEEEQQEENGEDEFSAVFNGLPSGTNKTA